MKARWGYLIAFLILVAASAFAVLGWPRVYALVIDPVARIFWLLVRLLSAVDQEVYWILLIFAGFVLAALLIPGRKEELPHAYNLARRLPEDRIAYWKTLLELAQSDPNARLTLKRDLADLRQAAASVVDVEGPENAAFSIPKRANRFGRLLRLKTRPSQQDVLQGAAQLIHLLETSLEINNDRSNSNPSD